MMSFFSSDIQVLSVFISFFRLWKLITKFVTFRILRPSGFLYWGVGPLLGVEDWCGLNLLLQVGGDLDPSIPSGDLACQVAVLIITLLSGGTPSGIEGRKSGFFTGEKGVANPRGFGLGLGDQRSLI